MFINFGAYLWYKKHGIHNAKGAMGMFMTADELSEILRKEREYIDGLLKRWGVAVLTEKAEHDLRMGKRTELLGDMQAERNLPKKAKV